MERPNPTRGDYQSASSDVNKTIAAPPGEASRVEQQHIHLAGYEIGPELGRGGMGIVYEATDLQLGRRVALKILPAAGRVSKTRLARFRNEAHAAALLQHENIVPVYGVEEQGDLCFYTMRLIEGQTLAQIIRVARSLRRDRSSRGLRSTLRNAADTTRDSDQQHPGVSKTADSGAIYDFLHEIQLDKGARSGRKFAHLVGRVGIQVASALQHAHDHGIVHRDVKPSNLMCDPEGRAWVTDFGLARLQDGQDFTRTGEMIGTLHYMSPEQAAGERALVDHRSDIYSLGATLYELATLTRSVRGHSVRDILRELAFDRPVPIRKVDPRLPADLEVIISKCMERNPADRYQSCAEVAADFERLLRGEQPRARPLTWNARFRNWVIARPTTAASLAVGLAAVALMGTALAVVFNAGLVAERKMRMESDAGRLLALSALESSEDPPLAIGLARAGARLRPGPDADQTLLNAISSNRLIHDLSDLKLPARAMQLNAAGDRLLSYGPTAGRSKAYEAVLVDLLSAQVIARLDWKGRPRVAAMTPDGNRIVLGSAWRDSSGDAGSDSGELQLLEIRAEKAALQFEASGFYLLDPQRPCFLHIGSEADAVLVADASGTACAVDLRGQVIRRFPTEDDLVAATAAEDGRQMAVLDSAGNVELFNVQTNQQANWRIDDLGSNCQLQFSGNGRFLLVQRSSPSVVWVIDTTAPDAETRSWRGSTGLLSHDGSRIYLRTDLANSVRVEVRTVSGNQRLGVWEADGQVAGWSLVDRERLLAVAHRDQVLLLDADDLSHRGTCAGHADRILSVVADRRSDRMATRDRLGKVMLWSSHSDRERRSIQLNWSPSGPLLCDMAEDDPSIALAAHAIGTVTSLYSPRVPERESLNLDGTMVGLMPDGRLLLWEQDRLRLWNASGTRILDEVDIEPIQHALTAVHVVPEGDLAFIVNRKSGATYLYRTGRLVQRLDDPDAGSVAHSIAEVAPRIAMRYRDGRLVVRDVVTMQEFALGTIDTRWRSFKLAPDGKRIYLRDGHEIECRDVESGEVVFTREIPADDIRLMIPVNTDRMVIVSTGRNDSNLSAELWELSESPRKIVSTLVNRMQGWELTPDLRYVCFGTHDGLAVIDVGGGTVSRRQPGRLTLARPFSTDLFYLSLEGPQTGSDPREAVTSETSQTSDRNGDPSLRRAELYRWSPDGEDQRLAEIRVRPRMTRFAYNGRVVAASFEEAKFIELTFNNARYDRPIRLEVSRLNTRGISKPKANARLLPSRAAARCTSTIIADVWNAN